MSRVIDPRERAKSHADVPYVDFYAQALKASEQFRADYKGRMNVVKASEMPLERSPDGLIKHIINEHMSTKECCLDIYMQFIAPGGAIPGHREATQLSGLTDLRPGRRPSVASSVSGPEAPVLQELPDLVRHARRQQHPGVIDRQLQVRRGPR